MAVAMHKKRAWSTRADDAESQESAAFEAYVAAAKDTAAKSGAFLSTAKSDLTDHQRWLRAQTAAVEHDRQRHERWLQRQRNYRLAAARKERQRRRRDLMRQRAFQAMRHAFWAAVQFVRSWFAFAVAQIWAGISHVGGLIPRGVSYVARQIAAGAKCFAGLIARGAVVLASRIREGIAWLLAKVGLLARQLGEGISAGATWTGSKALASARAGSAALVSGSSLAGFRVEALSRTAGRSLGGVWLAVSARGSALADRTGRVASQKFVAAWRKASALQSAVKRNGASGFRWAKTQAATATPALYVGMAKLGRHAEHCARAGAAHAKGIMARASAKASAPEPIALSGPHPEGALIDGRSANEPWTQSEALTPEPGTEKSRASTQTAEVYGPFYEGFWVDGVSPNEPRVSEASPAPTLSVSLEPEKNALSLLSSWGRMAQTRAAEGAGRTRVLFASWLAQAKVLAGKIQARARTRDVELSRMMIIAGAVLLVCGVLLLGGGLFLRSGAGTTATAVVGEGEGGTGIAWTFLETERPLPERAVFTLSGTPASFRINGLSVGGVNLSDQPLNAVEGVLKPDVKRPDLRLTLEIDPQTPPVGEGDAEVQAVVAAGTVPAGTAFRLVFPFPPEAIGEEDGITVDDYFESYGGLLLKLRYEVDGTQKSLIQYLPPEALKAQLDEVSAMAGG